MAIWHRLEKLKHHIPGINLKVSRWCNLSPRDCILGLLLKLLEIKYPPTDVVVRMIYKLKSVGNHLSIMWRRVENFTLVQQYGGYNGTSQILVMFFLFSVSRHAWKYPLSFKLHASRNSQFRSISFGWLFCHLLPSDFLIVSIYI